MEKYREIQLVIERLIMTKQVNRGDKLPSIRGMSRRFGCSAATVLKAYEGLVAQHIIYNAPRRGYFVVREPKTSVKEPIYNLDSLEALDEALPIGTYKQFVNIAMQTYDDQVLRYTDVLGMQSLREIVANQLMENQVFTSYEDVAISSGSQQSIDILFKMTYPNAKKKILLEHPTYEGALFAAQNNRQEVAFVNRTDKGLDLQAIEQHFKDGDIKCFYIVPRYHNPTGHSLDVHTRKKLYELACAFNVYLIEDDYLVDFDNSTKLPPIKHFDTEGRVVYLKSFSKTFLPGMRVACVVLPKRIQSAFRTYKQWSDLATNTLSQCALSVFLNSKMHHDYLNWYKKLLVKKHLAFRLAFEAHGDTRIILTLYEGSIFAGIRIEGRVDWEAIQLNLLENGIKVSSPTYGVHPYSEPYNGIRLSMVGLSIEEITSVIPRILNVVSQILDRNEE